MDSPTRIASSQEPEAPCSSGRGRRSSDSPEFEFWMVRNPSFAEPDVLSADELFVDGVLLPLHLLHLHDHHHPDPEPPNSKPHDSHNSIALAEGRSPPLTASKRWKLDILFKKGQPDKDKDKDKDKKKEKKNQTSSSSSAELNINIWPFSRSRSAGNNSGARSRLLFPRKVSSAPCSRSNSAGDSKYSRKWPSSPGRPRTSPVWQVRRGAGVSRTKTTETPVIRSSEKTVSKRKVTVAEHRSNKSTIDGNTKTKVVNVNVPLRIGYRQHLICRSDHNTSSNATTAKTTTTTKTTTTGEGRNGGGTNSTSNVGTGGNLFNLRTLFSTRKVY